MPLVMHNTRGTADLEKQILFLLPGNVSTDIKILWTTLFAFTMEIRQSLAAMNVYAETIYTGISIPNEQKVLWDLNIQSVWRRLVSDITKVFDKGKTFKKTNCSVMYLKQFCLQEDHIFQGKEKDPYIIRLDALQQEYERVITSTIRNKTVAHHDYDTMRKGKESYIDLNDINHLIENLSTDIIQLGKRLFNLDFGFPPLNELQQQFKKAIVSMITVQENV